MKLYRLKLRPLSPWRTPWQADTLAGSLCAVCARLNGPDTLISQIIGPMLVGTPPFILSDACPGDYLPVPISIRAQAWPPERYKAVKRARWLSPAAFEHVRRCEPLSPSAIHEEMLADDRLLLVHSRQHNTLSRSRGTTGLAESGLGLFERPDIHLRTHSDPRTLNPSLNGADYLSLYFRAVSAKACDLLMDLLEELAQTGFGADVATGRGQFDILDDPVEATALDAPLPGANAVVCLSTFQPGPTDPTLGCWDAFPKFGKLGPDFGLADVRKRTLILFHPGACFRADTPRKWLGRAIPMEELLPPESTRVLQDRGINVIHPAFGLAVSARIDWNAIYEDT